MFSIKYILTGIGIIGVFISGYGYGKSATTNKYKAIVANIEAMYAKEEQNRYKLLAAAEQQARIRLQQETEQSHALAKKLNEAQQKLVQEASSIKRKINDVSKNAHESCPGMPIDWVLLYNQALGLSTPSNPTTSTTFNTPRLSSNTSTTESSISRVQPVKIDDSKHQTQVMEVRGKINSAAHQKNIPQQQHQKQNISQNQTLTTPQDILVHLQDYGSYCQNLAIQLQALTVLLEANK